jgi:hypothetical protein
MTGLIYVDTGVGFAAVECVCYCSFISLLEYEST